MGGGGACKMTKGTCILPNHAKQEPVLKSVNFSYAKYSFIHESLKFQSFFSSQF